MTCSEGTNQANARSAWVCGCDPGAKHHCESYPLCCFGRNEDYDGPEPVETQTVPKATTEHSASFAAIMDRFEPDRVSIVMALVEAELRRALELHPRPQVSLHEAYAVLLEEVDELWDVVKRKHDSTRLIEARMKATQVAAMAARLLHDIQ